MAQPKSARLNSVVSAALKTELKTYAASRGIKMQDIVGKALIEYLRKKAA